MKRKETEKRSLLGGNQQTSSVYWCGFSVCLFVVLLAVFTWALHYRLAQYEPPQSAGGHVPAAKMCLTERNQMLVASIHYRDGSLNYFSPILFGVAFAFANVSLGFGKSSLSLVIRDSQNGIRFERSKSCLTHFFFLPPPAVFATL